MTVSRNGYLKSYHALNQEAPSSIRWGSSLDSSTLIESFDVGDSSLYIKHKVLNRNTMSVEFTTFSSKSIRKSGTVNNTVNSYGFLNYQDCLLAKLINGK